MRDKRREAGRRARIALAAALVACIACIACIACFVVGIAEVVSPTGSIWLAVLMFVLAASAGWRVTIYFRLLRRSQ
ncbi:hypothetical protein [Curtobacterium sp. SL109]|uniref:hypothetical protein n=1 Tax=Curtobacterium sp. SL109 TaxID=2994662 RepID=UPI00227580D1|nr:hypothetical protein [Curtobacterium sp. SL109]MCY1695275.1 hypothetical protein [Curtobacterium sp. SL109]